jgi:hypothetical protein
MNDDVRKVIYWTVAGFLAVVVAWVGFIYVRACGYTFTCNRAAPLVVRTPIPTLIPAEPGSPQMESAATEFNRCAVSAADLIGAWVDAGSSPTEAFPFTGLKGQTCDGTFSADVKPLFFENNLWTPRAIGCVSCHNSDLGLRSGGLDLTSVDAMRMGAGRADASSTGSDIFGGGNWKASSLYNVLVNQGLVAAGHSADAPPEIVILYAGEVVEPSATPTP